MNRHTSWLLYPMFSHAMYGPGLGISCMYYLMSRPCEQGADCHEHHFRTTWWFHVDHASRMMYFTLTLCIVADVILTLPFRSYTSKYSARPTKLLEPCMLPDDCFHVLSTRRKQFIENVSKAVQTTQKCLSGPCDLIDLELNLNGICLVFWL